MPIGSSTWAPKAVIKAVGLFSKARRPTCSPTRIRLRLLTCAIAKKYQSGRQFGQRPYHKPNELTGTRSQFPRQTFLVWLFKSGERTFVQITACDSLITPLPKRVLP